jgi:hypothetical protein
MATEATRPDADTDAGDPTYACLFLVSFEEGRSGADAEMVEIGAVSVPACPDHEEEMREEYEGGR